MPVILNEICKLLASRRRSVPLHVVFILALLAGLIDSSPWRMPVVSAAVQSAPPLSLPAGFADQVIVSGLSAPRAFEFAPDGRIFILQLGSPTSTDINFGSVRIFKNGALQPNAALTLNICGDGERGLLGIALDPNFTTNGYLYLYYTRQAASGAPCVYNTFVNNQPGPRNRVSRFTMSGDTINTASEVVLIDNISTDSGIHNAGDLHFGADGYLYVSVGDSNAQPSPAQDLTRLNGKILRILPSPGSAGGYTTAGNPFNTSSSAWYCGTNPPGSGAGPCREIFAYGLRNPFRFSIKPGTSTPFVGDVGGGVWEEIDTVIPGGNYGYPIREGPCPGGVMCTLPQPPSGYNEPIYFYPHQVVFANIDSAVIAGPFYTGAGYPAEYLGNLFFTDFVQGWIKRLVYNNTTGQWNAVAFATGGSGLIGLRIGLDTDLYYLSFASDTLPTSEIHRIHYQPGINQPPVAQISATPSGGPVSTLFTFSAAGSTDPDGNLPLIYHWDFGDGTTLNSTSAVSPTKTYTSAGAKVVTLTVTDSNAAPATSQPVHVTVHPGDNPPTATIVVSNVTAPGRGLYYAGDTWGFSVASSSDDHPLPLPANAFSWEVVFHHRTHTHPFLSGISGSSGQFTIPASGETDPVVWYQVVLHVTDSVGQVTTVTRDVNPTTVPVNLNTNPAGGSVVLEGQTHSTPCGATRVVGIRISLDVPSPQLIGISSYGFSSWSNGGSKSQILSVPAGGGSYTANFTAVASPPSPVLPAALPFQVYFPWIVLPPPGCQ